jgi:hypothetical protein
MAMLEHATLRPGGRSRVYERHLHQYLATHERCQRCADHSRVRLAAEAVSIPGIGLRSLCKQCVGVMTGPPAPKARRLNASDKRQFLERFRLAFARGR